MHGEVVKEDEVLLALIDFALRNKSGIKATWLVAYEGKEMNMLQTRTRLSLYSAQLLL